MKRSLFLRTVAFLGYVFLYAPIVSLVIFSFNENKLVTVWSGFSVKWYGELLQNDQLIRAGLLSLQIAALSATLALVLGTIGLILALNLAAWWLFLWLLGKIFGG